MRLLFFVLFFAFSLKAVEATRVNSVNDIAKDAHLANINALLIFTSQKGLNTGLFHFTKLDLDMQIYNLPFRYHFKSDTDLNYFIIGNVGYSRVYGSNDYIVKDTGIRADSQLQTYTAGLGLGVRYKVRDDFTVLGGLELIYSRSGINLKHSNGNLTNDISDFFSDNYNENISYKVVLETDYRPEVKYLNPYFNFSYRFYDTKSDYSFENLFAFSTQSSVFTVSLGAESDELYYFDQKYFTLEAYLTGNYLNGDVVKSVKFDHFAKAGAIAYLYLNDEDALIERFYLEVSNTVADGLEGYNIGVGFTLNY